MTPRILAATSPGEVRVAVEQDGQLLDYTLWRPGAPDGVGDLYRGRVIAHSPPMSGSFVGLGGEQGFLPDSRSATQLEQGDVVLVRVTRSAQGGKGPRLTADLTPEERAAATGTQQGLLARGPGPLLELAAQYADAPVQTDDRNLAARLKPLLGDRVEIVPQAFDPDIEAQADALAEPDVALRGGQRLRFHPTPALVAIDVDAGAALADRGASHVALNRPVMPVLARQIRLRNLSGAILVDFAGMPSRRRVALLDALGGAMADDPLHPRLLGFTALGLAEIVRTRVRPPLHELLAGPHAAGLAALRQIAKGLESPPHRLPALRASPAIVAALQADTEALPDLARRAGRPLILRSDPGLRSTAWQIEDING